MCVLHVLFVILLQIHVHHLLKYEIFKYKKLLIFERTQIKTNKEALLNQDPDEHVWTKTY